MKNRYLLACLGLIGCEGPVPDVHSFALLEPGPLAVTQQLQIETHGIHLSEDTWGVAGMGGDITCEIDMLTGEISTDVDMLEDEAIVDGAGDTVLACDDGEACQTAEFPGGELGEGWAKPEGGTSRLLATGHVDLGWRGGVCEVSFHGEEVASAELPGTFCHAGDAFVAAGEVAWIGSSASLVRATAAGFVELPVPADRLAIDHDSGIVLVGDSAANDVTALDADGTRLWGRAFEAPVAGFDVHGEHAVVVLDFGDRRSELVLLDPATGEIVARQRARELPAGRPTLSDRFLVVESPEQFDFLQFGPR
jgi:hypothetical protein